MIAETTIGGIIGGVFRLAPELFKAWDRRNERKHELAMQDKALAFEQLRGANRMEEIRTQGDVDAYKGGLEALREAIRGQSQLTGVKVIDALNQSVRPVTTYYLLVLYGIAKTAGIVAVAINTGIIEALKVGYTSEDQAMLSAILNFWFLDRVLKK